MARKPLVGIAIAAGTGLGIIHAAFGHHGRARQGNRGANLKPLIHRIDRIEARVAKAEMRPVTEFSREIELLRISAAETEKRVEAEIRLTGRRFEEAAASLPEELDALVTPRVEDLSRRMNAEVKESAANALQSFEASLDSRFSSCIAALEQKLLEQCASLAELSRRASQSDTNLQRLIDAVERLCEQRAAESVTRAAPSLESTGAPVPLIWPVVREEAVSRRSRFTLAHVAIAAAWVLIGVRFVR